MVRTPEQNSEYGDEESINSKNIARAKKYAENVQAGKMPVPKSMNGYSPLAGFSNPPAPKRQAIALLFGLPGSGKTTLGLLHAPDPSAFFDIDRRGDHAARKAQRAGKRISYTKVSMPKKALTLQDQNLRLVAVKEVKRVLGLVEHVAREGQKGNVRTAVFDTMTEFCSLVNMSVTGRVDKRKDDFGKSTHIVKSVIKDIIETFRETPVNLIMLARAKELWVGHEPTGKYTYQGLDTMDYECDWAAHIRLARDRKTKLMRSQQHEMEITKAGISLKQLGQVYTEEEWEADGDGPFVYACVQNYPGSKPGDWK